MFKKKCKRCGKEIKGNYSYCPFCGFSLKKEEDYGLLGRDDFDDSIDGFFGGMNFPGGINSLINQMVRSLDGSFKEIDNSKRNLENPKIKRGGFSIKISSGTGRPPEIKVKPLGGKLIDLNLEKKEKKEEVEKEKSFSKISDKAMKRISKMEKKEPETNIRRLSDRIIYEIDLPGVKSIKNVSISKLENSIEIKALAEDKAYVKLIPISMPIRNYKLLKEKLILELEAQ
jgi:hypothetical protein